MIEVRFGDASCDLYISLAFIPSQTDRHLSLRKTYLNIRGNSGMQHVNCMSDINNL